MQGLDWFPKLGWVVGIVMVAAGIVAVRRAAPAPDDAGAVETDLVDLVGHG